LVRGWWVRLWTFFFYYWLLESIRCIIHVFISPQRLFNYFVF
jgi:hypothetical protein